MPWPLQEAINHGLAVLSWYENYVEKDIPPEPIWDDAEGTSEWFKAIRARKDDETTGGRPAASDNGDGDSEGGEEKDGSMMGNEYASYFRE